MRELLADGGGPAGRRSLRPADSRPVDPGGRPRRPGRRPPRAADHRPLGRSAAADRALLTRTLVHLGDGADAALVEELVASPGADEAATQAFFTGTLEVTLDANATPARWRASRSCRRPSSRIQHRAADLGEGASLRWALAQLGGRLVRSRIDNRLRGDRSRGRAGRDRLRSRRAAVRPHLLHDAHRPGHDRRPAVQGRAARPGARTYLKGLITIEKSAVGTDSFLGEFGMNLSKAARSVAIPSLEIDQPDCRRAAHSSSVGPSTRPSCSTSSRAASRRTRRASSSCSASSSRSSPGSRSRPPRTACATPSRRSGRPAATPSARSGGLMPPQPPSPEPRPVTGGAALMRRIDLLAVDEVADGEMRMVWVDGTDQVLVINTGGEFTAVQGICSHEYFELDKGFLTNGTLTCALHLSRFDLSNGEPLDPPAEAPARRLPGRHRGRPCPRRGARRPVGDQRLGARTGACDDAGPGRGRARTVAPRHRKRCRKSHTTPGLVAAYAGAIRRGRSLGDHATSGEGQGS